MPIDDLRTATEYLKPSSGRSVSIDRAKGDTREEITPARMSSLGFLVDPTGPNAFMTFDSNAHLPNNRVRRLTQLDESQTVNHVARRRMPGIFIAEMGLTKHLSPLRIQQRVILFTEIEVCIEPFQSILSQLVGRTTPLSSIQPIPTSRYLQVDEGMRGLHRM